jgi:hypothetical protein
MNGRPIWYSLSVVAFLLERDSVVGIATSYGLNGPEFLSRQEQEIFSSPETVQTVSRANAASYSMGIGILSRG